MRHQAIISAVAFNTDGKTALTGSIDGEVRQWPMAELPDDLGRVATWVEALTGKGPLRPGLSHGDAVDIMWLLMSPDNYYRLVHRRRWTPQ